MSFEFVLIGSVVPTPTRNIIQGWNESKTVPHECNAEPSNASKLGSMGNMKYEGYKEADILDGYRGDHIQQKMEEGSDR
jgi:hypothetical protein